jgi:hypothetical protein
MTRDVHAHGMQSHIKVNTLMASLKGGRGVWDTRCNTRQQTHSSKTRKAAKRACRHPIKVRIFRKHSQSHQQNGTTDVQE